MVKDVVVLEEVTPLVPFQQVLARAVAEVQMGVIVPLHHANQDIKVVLMAVAVVVLPLMLVVDHKMAAPVVEA